MKKKNFLKLIFGSFVLGLLGMSSCKNCYTCSYSGRVEKICNDNTYTQQEFKRGINNLEDSGWECK